MSELSSSTHTKNHRAAQAATRLGLGLLLALAPSTLAACSDDPEVTHGKVIEKPYDGPTVIILHQNIKTGEVCSGSGSTRFCSSTYTQLTQFIPVPEHFGLQLEDCTQLDDDGVSCATGRVEVDEATYNQYEVGEEYWPPQPNQQ